MKRARATRWTRCPAGWEPKEDHRQIAQERGVDLELELAKFRDHEFAKARTDADATFRNWLRNAKQPPKPAGGQRAADLTDRLTQRVRDLEAQESRALTP